MASVLAAALLLQQDWSAWRAPRPASPEDLAVLHRSLREWAARFDVPELREGAGRAVLIWAQEFPIYGIRVRTLVEDRRLERVRRPWREGGTRRRQAEVGDVWAYPVPPPPAEWPEDQEVRVAVTDSAEVRPCDRCEGRGRARCDACRGEGRRACAACGGSRSESCPTCRGLKELSCAPCAGTGTVWRGSRRTRCSACSGRGRRPCIGCSGGRISCRSCRGASIVQCADCAGEGRRSCPECEQAGSIEEVLRVYVHRTLRRTETVRSRLDDDWLDRLRLPDGGWTTVEEAALAETLAKVPDPWLAEVVDHAVNLERRSLNPDRVTRKAVDLRRIPVWIAGCRWGEDTYSAVFHGGTVVMADSPARRLARRAATEAGVRLQRGDVAEAKRLALVALKCEPDNGTANKVYREASGREPGAPDRAAFPRTRSANWQEAALAVLIPVAGLVALVMAGLKVYLGSRSPSRR